MFSTQKIDESLCLRKIFILWPFDGLSTSANITYQMKCKRNTFAMSKSIFIRLFMCMCVCLWFFFSILSLSRCQPNQSFFCRFFSRAHYPFSIFHHFFFTLKLSFVFMFIWFLSIVEMIQLVVKNLSLRHTFKDTERERGPEVKLPSETHEYQITYFIILILVRSTRYVTARWCSNRMKYQI